MTRRVVDLRKKRTIGATLRKNMQMLPKREPAKRSPLRARRRRTRALIGLALVAGVGVVAYGVSYASHLPQLSVQSVDVHGAQEIRESLLRTYVETILHDGAYSFLSRTNVLLYPRREIERAVKEFFPRVANVDVSRESLLATAVIISIKEREAFARWCTRAFSRLTDEYTDSCYVMDKNGFVFASVDATTARTTSPYVFRGSLGARSASERRPIGQAYLPDHFLSVAALLDRLEQAGFAPLSIEAENGKDFSITLTRGYELRMSFGADIESTARNLELILASEPLRSREGDLEYIDLRFGNRVYYKLQGESAVSAN